MKQRNVGILIFDDVEVLDFAGPFEVFNVAGEIPGKPFNVYTIGITGNTIMARGGLNVTPTYSLYNCPTNDILLIPGGAGTRPLLNHKRLLTWITDQAGQVELLLSVCTGALLLAKAGLLANKRATTHHGAFELFASLDPTLILVEDQRFVDNGAIITSGGISAGIDMALYVVERLLGDGATAPVVEEMEWAWHPSSISNKKL